MRKYCLTLDLVDDQELILEYEKWHREVWPEVISSIKTAGIERMEIYRYGNRLVMMMEVNAYLRCSAKAAMDLANERVQEWEQLMWKYQQALPGCKTGREMGDDG